MSNHNRLPPGGHFTVPPVPYPSDWAHLFQILTAERDIRGLTAPNPPRPIILGGAAFSKASEIRQAWVGLVNWAKEYGLEDVLYANLPPAPPSDALDGSITRDMADRLAGISESGRGWWPEYGEQDHPARQKLSKDVVSKTLARLTMSWMIVVGEEIAEHTRPLRFTGKKKRRLVVSANPRCKPPWGYWDSASFNPAAFMRFRKQINQFILPMEVDDIFFSTGTWRRKDV